MFSKSRTFKIKSPKLMPSRNISKVWKGCYEQLCFAFYWILSKRGHSFYLGSTLWIKRIFKNGRAIKKTTSFPVYLMGWHPYFSDLCPKNENKAQRFVKIPDVFFRRRCCRLLRARKILHAWTEKAAKQGGKKERAQQEKRMGKNTKPQNRMQSSCTLSHVCWDISIRNELEIIFFGSVSLENILSMIVVQRI